MRLLVILARSSRMLVGHGDWYRDCPERATVRMPQPEKKLWPQKIPSPRARAFFGREEIPVKQDLTRI